MTHLRRFLAYCFEWPIVREALIVMLIVGSLLNCINQGPEVWNEGMACISWGKVLLTYSVPYLVSTYSAARVKMRA